jgi:hypothetical protein
MPRLSAVEYEAEAQRGSGSRDPGDIGVGGGTDLAPSVDLYRAMDERTGIKTLPG